MKKFENIVSVIARSGDNRDVGGIGNVIIGRVRRTDNLSLIKKEAAEVLGSCVASPRMTDEKGYCHLEPRAIARGCKDLINKCRDCIELTRLKQVRIKLKRYLYGDFACAQPLKMTMIICLVLSLGITSESQAATTCAWAKDTEGNDTTKLVISGTGRFIVSECQLQDWKTKTTGIEIKEGVTGFSGMFLNMSQVTGALVIPNSVTSLGYQTFQGMSGITSLTLPNNIKTIGNYMFSGMSGVTSLTIPDSVTDIGMQAFLNMSGVTGELKIPDSVTTIGSYAFDGMSSVNSIIIPDTVTSIGFAAFGRMKNVSSLTIPDSVTYIGNSVFFSMSGLKELIIADTLMDNLPDQLFDRVPANLTIRCQGDIEKCQKALKKFVPDENGKCAAGAICLKNPTITTVDEASKCTGKYVWENGQCNRMNEEQCNSALNSKGNKKYYYNGEICKNLPSDSKDMTCVGGYAKLKGNCVDPLKTFAKKRYTPAEAAQWLNEDNNTITLTFKK